MAKSPVDLEEAFSLIQQGKDFIQVDAHWDAAEAFDQAREILKQLADATDKNDNNDDHNQEEEKNKIAALYQSQSREYLHRARESLLAAMNDESESDQAPVESGTGTGGGGGGEELEDPVYLTLSDEDAEKRLRIFARLFSRELQLSVATVPTKENADDDDNNSSINNEKPVLEQQSSLEERLMQLNASLPSGFKTSTERMQDINRGLGRLGLSLYSAADEKPSLALAKSESDQVDDIIQQAKDELAMQPAVTDRPTAGVSASSS
jgi:hypothetical protein